jgi:hypothetical protein
VRRVPVVASFAKGCGTVARGVLMGRKVVRYKCRK